MDIPARMGALVVGVALPEERLVSPVALAVATALGIPALLEVWEREEAVHPVMALVKAAVGAEAAVIGVPVAERAGIPNRESAGAHRHLRGGAMVAMEVRIPIMGQREAVAVEEDPRMCRVRSMPLLPLQG